MSAIDEMPEGLKLAAQYEWPEGAYYVAVYGGTEVDFVSDCDRKPICSHEYSKEEHAAARQRLGLEPVSVPDKTDMVNHPPHYQLRQGYEVYDLRQDLAAKAAQANVPHDQYSDWDRMLEYALRCWQKNGVEDLKKARWYLDKLIEKLEAQK